MQQSLNNAHLRTFGKYGSRHGWFVCDDAVDAAANHDGHCGSVVYRPDLDFLSDSMGRPDELPISDLHADCPKIGVLSHQITRGLEMSQPNSRLRVVN